MSGRAGVLYRPNHHRRNPTMSKRLIYQIASLVNITRPIPRRAVVWQPRDSGVLPLPPLGSARKGRKK